MEILSNFHLLRPWWLILFPFWLLLALLLWRQKRENDGWSSLCDPALLTYLVGESTRKKRSRLALAGLMMAGVSAVVALAGPAWKQLPQPVYQTQSAMIIILDLSQSMLAEDMRPNRLIRARQKLQDILNLRQEGQTGLIVFAGSAFDVVPLTTDNKAIIAMLGALHPSMMPTQGSRASAALKRAADMFKRGVIHHGSVVLLSDGVDADAVAVAENLVQAGHQLSVLGVGTETGAPIPLQGGGFLKDGSGNIVIPRLQTAALQTLANAGNGIYQPIRVDDADVKSLPGLYSVQGEKVKMEDFHSDQWQEEGPWLVLLLLPLLLPVFRRGVLLLVFLLPVFSPDLSYAFEWKDVWQTPDQQGEMLFKQEQSEQAAAKFENPEWKAAALYRTEKFKESAKTLKAIKSADAHYNRGNALAKSGDMKAAIEAYEQALKIDKRHEDAKFNRDLIKKIMQKQQSDQHQSKDQKESNKSDKSDKSEQQSGGKQQDKQGDKSENSERPGQQSDEQQQQNDEKQSQSGQEKKAEADAKKEKERQQQAMQSAEHTEQSKAEPEKKDVKAAAEEKEINKEDAEEMQSQQQWLRRIPDDPGGLLRRKFRYQYRQRGQQQASKEGQAW